MKFVLVPGAWIGAWAFREVEAGLRAKGHQVFSCSLTGLAERKHLAQREVDLETHLTDVLNVLEADDLRGVTLVGHSYGGIVVTGVADRAGERLERLVYLDTAPFTDGQAHIDFSSSEEQAELRKTVETQGEGWKLPFPGVAKLGPPPVVEGLTAFHRTLLEQRSVSQPFRTYTQPLKLTGQSRGSFRRVLIACNPFRMLEAAKPSLASFLTREWTRFDLPATGHWPMFSKPAELVELLVGSASEGPSRG